MKKLKGILLLIIILFLGIWCSKLFAPKEIFYNDNINLDSQNNYIEEIKILYKSKKFQRIKVIKEKDKNTPYSIYSYKGDVGIIIDGETVSLKQALDSNKITIEVILSKANNDKKAGIAKCEVYEDGGSESYQYPTYSILKCKTLDGKQDVYIGSPKMNINDLF